MITQPIEKLDGLCWFPFSDEPLLKGEMVLPSVCDPQVLLPHESPDGRWHMFVHTWLGLHHYVSDSGIAWEPMNMIEFRCHSPFVYVENNVYYLLYERHDKKIPLVGHKQNFRDNEKNDDSSRIEIISSLDLTTWSRPRILLDSRSINYSTDYNRAPRVSRPQLVKVGLNYRLYFGVSHNHLPDTGQRVNRYFSCAESSTIDGLYKLSNKGPLLVPDLSDPYSNLGIGSVRVLQGDIGFAAFVCSAYWDESQHRSRTAMFLYYSEDGYKWVRSSDKPILVPSTKGWAKDYIMSCDVHYKPNESCWYCYFSANAQRKYRLPLESIGLLIGQLPK